LVPSVLAAVEVNQHPDQPIRYPLLVGVREVVIGAGEGVIDAGEGGLDLRVERGVHDALGAVQGGVHLGVAGEVGFGCGQSRVSLLEFATEVCDRGVGVHGLMVPAWRS
jgi:hypothetical protein